MHTQHTAGDTLSYGVLAPAYPPSAGWVVSLRLVPLVAGSDPISVPGTVVDGQHRVEASAATTAAWPAGGYTWVEIVTRGAERHTLGMGMVTISPDVASLPAGTDTRSLAERTLAALEQAYATWCTTKGNVKRYKIMEREMEFHSAGEIQAQIEFWSNKVKTEKEAARIAAGGKPRNRLLVRFARPR